jgi:hypothetical protein
MLPFAASENVSIGYRDAGIWNLNVTPLGFNVIITTVQTRVRVVFSTILNISLKGEI